ncbi:hypothetical protein DL767_004898 [Monosporascus sp. MG133]|nr:hypothetical protein DL767_004898 [Monosporascus sp. MG133]
MQITREAVQAALRKSLGPEAQTPGAQTPESQTPIFKLEEDADPNLVTWNGPDDVENPKNWAFAIRWRLTIIASAFSFISPVSTSITAPALGAISVELHMDQEFERFLSLSICILASAFGPFLAGPLSEMYGRPPVLQLFNLFYLYFNTACGFATTGQQLIVCRFFAGFGGSAATATGAGILGDVWKTEERGLIAGLNYLALAIGYILGTQICTRLIDVVYKRLKETRGKGTGLPEYRLPLLLPGALMVPIGLFWYGWSAQSRLHWIMPDIGIAIFGAGVKFALQCTQLYALDVYPTYAASASAASMFVICLAGFAFPLFAPYLYLSLQFGWGDTLLVLIALVLGVPAPFFLWYFGPSLRRRSPYAAG